MKPIKLVPQSSDYATFAKNTAKALGKPEPSAEQIRKGPNKLLLKILNLG